MHQICWARVHIDISLDARDLSFIWVVAAASIHDSTEHAKTKEHKGLNDWPKQNENHGANDDVASHLKPGLVKVALDTIQTK